ncbi:MAG: 6-hydroxymethylpterin diphosphokinase MptE-like protein [Eubacterium sp.]|nr:6-hydroxymethylpterin diphosphokinase MptE-like protein [Eubacterium sp.]
MVYDVSSAEEFECVFREIVSENVYIVGAGVNGDLLGQYLNYSGHEWCGYVDGKRTNVMNDKPCVHYSDETIVRDAVFIVSSIEFGGLMIRDLVSNGLGDNNIIRIRKSELVYDLFDKATHYRVYTDRLKRFKDIHSGGRCFVIGNGPSLAPGDLDQISNEITIASNSVYAIYPYTSWRPTYYTTFDENFLFSIYSKPEKRGMLSENCRELFTAANRMGFQYRNEETLKNVNYFLFSPGYLTSEPLFSDDISKIVYDMAMVTYINLQLACYMGIKEIYFLGVDYSYSIVSDSSGKVTRREGSDYNEILQTAAREVIWKNHYITREDRQLEGFFAAKKYADSHGIKIYNATRGGKLEVFERVKLDDITGLHRN